MSQFKFTPAQTDAIYARGGSIIVSAAAGSGKTRILVQRVIERLTDSENPISADRLLIVTFTNAAAAEMKSRIISALEERIDLEPSNEALLRQRRLLPNADICTIHSFCSRIIRENFYRLNIGQDFRIASQGEATVIQSSVLSELLDERYARADSDFLAFADNVSGEKNDRAVAGVVISMYEYMMSHPFPRIWLEQAVNMYCSEAPLLDTEHGAQVLKLLPKEVDFICSLLSQYERTAEKIGLMDAKLDDKLLPARQTAASLAESLKTLSDDIARRKNINWDKLKDTFEKLAETAIKQPNKPKEKPDDETNAQIRSMFERLSVIKDFIKDFFKSKSQKIFFANESEYREDNKKLLPVLLGLKSLMFDFMDRYEAEKRKKNTVDFADLEHLLLKLLVKPSDNDGGYEKTDFARELSDRYDEIMVDEYQDSNNAQEMIFTAVSRDNTNCFVVGDVKQSIYRFREAMPENFIHRKSISTLYDRQSPRFPARIVLDRNFRSRRGVTDSVNFVFGQLMSEDLGEIDYNDEEKLVAAAEYPPADFSDADLHIVLNETLGEGVNEETNDKAEGKYIAELIEELMHTATVTENGVNRPARYGDFCILMRNMSSHASDFAKQLENAGIPVFVNRGVSLFSCSEVRAAIVFLKTLDNPLCDVPLLSVLMHPVFGFSPDDMAYIRAECPHKYIYVSIGTFSERFKESEDCGLSDLARRCEEFLGEIEFYRRLAVTLPTDKLLSVFFERSGFMSFVSAMKGGSGRVKNLHRFLTCAREYEGENFKGLTGFVRFLNRLEETGSDMTASDTAPADAVRIMSIHHSKGLEFPICILASTNAQSKKQTDSIVRHARLGIGLMSVDSDHMLKSTTLQREIILDTLRREKLSEELRVLYVAMTRPKERLIIVSSFRSGTALKKKLSELSLLLSNAEEKISPVAAARVSNLSDWILMSALRHPSMQRLRQIADCPNIKIAKTESQWSLTISQTHPKLDILPKDTAIKNIEADTEFMSLLENRLSFRYPREERTRIPSKVTASEIAHSKSRIRYAAAKRPNFMQKKQLSGSERGTALHTFMQYSDFASAQRSIENEIKRLKAENILSADQCDALDLEQIRKFLDSNLYARMRKSKMVKREYQFTANIRASEVIENLGSSAEDEIMLQGAVDCLFEEDGGIVIVDYKTDRVKVISELEEHYHIQLMLYKRAIEQSMKMRVTNCILYSLFLSEEISVYKT